MLVVLISRQKIQATKWTKLQQNKGDWAMALLVSWNKEHVEGF